MCELFGVSSNKRIRINEPLGIFFSHSVEHRNGWGLALPDDTPVFIEKEPVRAIDSSHLDRILKNDIVTAGCIAHIRRATIGEVGIKNTHPFFRRDDSGRMWVLAHNGTIFDSEVLAPYQYLQDGTTDSERILLYIVDKMNKYYKQNGEQPDADQRVRIVDDVIREITPGNKVNLMLCDGELFYVHKNEAGTLYFKETDGSVIFSTQSLGPDGWTETAQNRLLVYKDGELFYAGRPHDHTYIHDEEKMKLLYFEYSGL